MTEDSSEDDLMRAAALQNAQSIFLARQRAERELLLAKEALERKTEELAQQREWFQVTLSSIGDAVITTDTDARVTFLNPVAEALTGWKVEDACGKPLAEVFHIINEESRERVQNPVGKAIREGVVVGLANYTTLISREGKATPIEDSAAPIKDLSGRTSGAVMVFHDVTERRRTEQILTQSEARLKLAMEAGGMGAWEWMIGTGKVNWSPTLEAIHGLLPGSFGGGFADVLSDIHPEDRERVVARIQKSVQHRTEYQVEYRILKPDGTLRWIEARGKLFTDPPERMAGICMDITERRQVNEALRESEEFNRTIIESSRDCTNTLTLDGVLLWMSETAQKSLCVPDLPNVVGKSWIDFWSGDVREAARAAVQAAASGGNGKFVGWYTVQGQPRCWDVVVTPVLDRTGQPEKLLAVARDVTERRKLEEVHSRLAGVVEFSDDAIISKTLQGVITTWNSGAERMFGYRAEEVIGQPITIVFPADRTNEEPVILERVRRGEVMQPYETVRIRKDGSLIDVSLTVSPIKDARGAIIGVSSIARDITQQKRSQAERARLTSTLEKSLNEIYIFGRTEMRFQYVNQGALQNLGYTMDQMRQMTPLDLKPEFTEKQFREMVQPLLQGEKEKLLFYTVHRRANGSCYPVEVHLQSVASGDEAVFLAVILDITERKKAEEDRERLLALEQAARARAEETGNRARFLAEASKRLASTMDLEATLGKLAEAAVPEIADWCAVHLQDSHGIVRVVAMAHVDPSKRAIAAELHERYPDPPDSPQGVPEVLRSRAAMLYTDIPDELLEHLARDDHHLGLLRSLGLSSAVVVPIVSNDRALGAITLVSGESGRRFTEADLPFVEDLAARAATTAENARLYQELRHANAAKDHFMAVLSHELRTPLNPVLMTVADLESDETIAPAIREQLTVVRRNVELEARLIDDLLDSTRIANGKLQLHRTVVDATEIVQRAVSIVEGDARAHGVELAVKACPAPYPVDADPARLQQVIWNVVKNAVKFTPQGGWVRVACEAAPENRLLITIADSGIGIDRDHLDKIFNAFEQGDTATGHRFGGLGLGLAISKALVTLHGGKLTAQSEGRGRGATFIIDLPLAAQPSEAIASDAGPGTPRHSLRLLVVEDHEATSKVMMRLLTKRGYAVFAAASIREALTVLEQTPVDLLISDVGLPDGSGRELMEKVREMRHLPGIALSGYGTEEDLARSSAVGFSAHLTKPVNIDRLDREIQSLASRITIEGEQ